MDFDEAPVKGAQTFLLLIARALGLAPITFHTLKLKAENDKKISVRRIVRISKLTRILSLLSVFPIAGIGLYGLYKELTTERGLSVWMNSTTGRMVGSCNVGVVVASSLVAICTAPSRIKNVIFVLKVLDEIDHGLGYVPVKKDERNKCLMIILILIAWSCLLGFDVLVYIVEAFSLNTHLHFIRNFVCFYILYYVVMMMATHFAFMTHSINMRLRNINNHLQKILDDSVEVVFKKVEKVPIVPNHITVEVQRAKKEGKSIHRLSKYHGMIYLVAKEVESAFGLPVFIILIGTLLHLIVTPYFLILELSTNRLSHVFVQSLWCLAHATRLILLVEPCHKTKMEATRTHCIIADMIGKTNLDKDTVNQLNTFSRQLFHRSINFTALGVCNLDRTLIASVATAVTTYLVILIQFQK